jgi:hypothetical protein
MTSHFASGVENVQNRIKQYHQSMDCKFICQSERNIIIWMGDFNSRLDLDEDFDEITSKLKINSRYIALCFKIYICCSSRIDLLESCDQIK